MDYWAIVKKKSTGEYFKTYFGMNTSYNTNVYLKLVEPKQITKTKIIYV